MTEHAVTQADRDGSADFWKGLINGTELQAMRDGKRDGHWKIQGLASRRITSARPTGGEGLREALERIANIGTEAYDGLDAMKIARQALNGDYEEIPHTPYALRDQACAISISQGVISIECDDIDDTEEVFNWLIEQ